MMTKIPTTAGIPDLIEAINDLTSKSVPPPADKNGRKYAGGGAIGAAAILTVWLLTLLMSQGTAVTENSRDTQAVTTRVKTVEDKQEKILEVLSKNVTNTEVLAQQVKELAERMARMDRIRDKDTNL
jgi:hypothetical protein